MAWLRWTGLFVGPATLAVSLPLTAVDSRPGVRTGALVGVIVMAAWWVMGYRRRGFIWFADLVAAVALAAIATALSDPAQVLCSYFVALCYRALFGQKRDIWFAGLVIAGSYAATVVAGNGWDSPSLLGQHLMPAALLLLAARCCTRLRPGCMHTSALAPPARSLPMPAWPCCRPAPSGASR